MTQETGKGWLIEAMERSTALNKREKRRGPQTTSTQQHGYAQDNIEQAVQRQNDVTSKCDGNL